MNKKDKLIYLISVGLCVVILLGKYLYGGYTKSKEPVVTRPGKPSYGIEIGNTTEQEIRDKFEVIKEAECIFNAKYKVFYLNVKDFSSEVLPVQKVEIVINQNGVVIRFRLIYSGKQFSKLHPKLSKKYKVVFSDIPFIGDQCAEYISNNILIQLDEPHMVEYVTYLCYVTKQIAEEIDAFHRKQKQENEQRIADQL